MILGKSPHKNTTLQIGLAKRLTIGNRRGHSRSGGGHHRSSRESRRQYYV